MYLKAGRQKQKERKRRERDLPKCPKQGWVRLKPGVMTSIWHLMWVTEAKEPGSSSYAVLPRTSVRNWTEAEQLGQEPSSSVWANNIASGGLNQHNNVIWLRDFLNAVS